MSGTRHNVPRLLLLLLLCFILTGINSEDGLDIPHFDVKYSCEESLVCFHIWELSPSETGPYIAIVSNGKIQAEVDDDLGCTLSVRFQADDIGHFKCQQGQDDSSAWVAPSVLTLMPGRRVSLQCVVIPRDDQEHCDAQVGLTWVDQAGTEIQTDSWHQIEQKSACDTTLTFTDDSPGITRFRCQATEGEDVWTSAELRVRVPVLKGKGRGLTIELEPKNPGEMTDGNQDVTGLAVGLVGCVVVIALVAAYAVNRRRTRNQLPSDSCYTVSTYNITGVEDVIYAEVVLPAGSGQVRASQYESTEYACVRRSSVQNI